ncbi:MGDG synthase family glycosyltransferase [Alistipes sp. ZOR0009]|jgi:processive 1,2-diacylglycerol beta-glucosyltransferase/1,2-diacylglycerol 3-beta-galactosyltransferase|uniref:MGDG synthase family glycosyltransferase n=1 Tax=Alistipes sp. ZOR0009 TaxID=1339253 RepID=UPI000647C963|nr:glycosyltransferase [Alistipes sp. ZOR0009]
MKNLGNPQNKRIALLYLRTGGGHEAPARSIASYLSHKYPESCTPMLYNCLENAPRYINGVVEDGYRMAQKRAKWVYSVLYELNKYRPFSLSTAALVGKPIKDYVRQVVLPNKPDKIVVLHFFIIKPVMDLVEELGLKIKVEVIVTDPFTAHPFWFLRKGPSYVLFSERLKEKVLKEKWADEDRIKVFPFIVNSRFERPMGAEERQVVANTLKINQSKKTILLLGGGDGMPGAMDILKSMVALRLDANIVVVCGRDEEQRRSLLRAGFEGRFASFAALGFVGYVYELINIADVVITKGGPNTIMEILMSGKIPIVNSYIWEQEKGNLEFVVQNGLGVYEPTPYRVGHAALRFISNDSVMSRYKERVRQQQLTNGTHLVSEYIFA